MSHQPRATSIPMNPSESFGESRDEEGGGRRLHSERHPQYDEERPLQNPEAAKGDDGPYDDYQQHDDVENGLFRMGEGTMTDQSMVDLEEGFHSGLNAAGCHTSRLQQFRYDNNPPKPKTHLGNGRKRRGAATATTIAKSARLMKQQHPDDHSEEESGDEVETEHLQHNGGRPGMSGHQKNGGQDDLHNATSHTSHHHHHQGDPEDYNRAYHNRSHDYNEDEDEEDADENETYVEEEEGQPEEERYGANDDGIETEDDEMTTTTGTNQVVLPAVASLSYSQDVKAILDEAQKVVNEKACKIPKICQNVMAALTEYVTAMSDVKTEYIRLYESEEHESCRLDSLQEEVTGATSHFLTDQERQAAMAMTQTSGGGGGGGGGSLEEEEEEVEKLETESRRAGGDHHDEHEDVENSSVDSDKHGDDDNGLANSMESPPPEKVGKFANIPTGKTPLTYYGTKPAGPLTNAEDEVEDRF